MKSDQGKISMRLFKKEKNKPRKKSITVIEKNRPSGSMTNQLEILFDPVFFYKIDKRLTVFFRRWRAVLSIYPIERAFYHINDNGIIKLYISFSVSALLSDIEIKHFFKAVQELLTAPDNTIESSDMVQPVFQTGNDSNKMNFNILDDQDKIIDTLQKKIAEQDDLVNQWSKEQDKEQKTLMEQLDIIEKENNDLLRYLDTFEDNKILPKKERLEDIYPTKNDENHQHYSNLSNELAHAKKLISDLENNNKLLSLTLNKASKKNRQLTISENKQVDEIKDLQLKVTELETENTTLKNLYQKEQDDKAQLINQAQLDTKEFEEKIAEQERQLLLVSNASFKMQAEMDELVSKKTESDLLIDELKAENHSVKNKLDQESVEKDNILRTLEEQKKSYWQLEKKLKEWIDKSQVMEQQLEEQHNKYELDTSSMLNDLTNLKELNQKLSEENIHYQNEMRRLLKEVNRLSDRVAYLQQFVDQTLVEEQEDISESKDLINEEKIEEEQAIRYDEDDILDLFQQADDAEVGDVKVPVEEYREYRLSLKFLEYRWYQANIMQVNDTGKSELNWSKHYVSEANEFFEELENLVKIPLLSKKYVIMDKEIKLRLKAYQALSDYLERRYFNSSKHFFDRETAE
ncbi:hypothetical protein [Vagococcus luciliae]|uniref:Uncharacterized protein n=1 Tax=Vagococcus luciliae TaxID=2920380 RepID=A0ABY5NX06_9ENTE|nr:hypothetical protein [Vagococcus luciliae]UUV97928.1 hypothetical protein G314FT_00180 [Vagococcus luciliae]